MPAASDVERRALLVQTTATVRGPVTLRVAPPRGQIGLRGDPAVPDCQSASKIDPLSACNIDPLSGTAEVVSVVNRGDPSGFV